MNNEVDDVTQHAIPVGDAIKEIRAQLALASLDTSRRIALKMAERAMLAEGTIKHIKRNLWSVICDIWSDEEADDLISRLMKRAERKKK